MKVSLFPPDIIDKYNLSTKISLDGYIYCKIKKGMYGLKEAAVLAYDQLTSFLNKQGQRHTQGTAGLWTHQTKQTILFLCVDDIGVNIT